MKIYVKNLVLSTKAKHYDWAGIKITKKNCLTCHHIMKRVYGGGDEASNLALLTNEAHTELHRLEHQDRERYNEVNQMLLEIDRNNPVPEETQQKIYKKLFMLAVHELEETTIGDLKTEKNPERKIVKRKNWSRGRC